METEGSVRAIEQRNSTRQQGLVEACASRIMSRDEKAR